MTEMDSVEKPVKTGKWMSVKTAAVGGLATVGVLAAPAAAEVDLNATISPLLTGVTELIPSLIDLIVAVVPAIVVLAIVGFIVGFLDQIIAALKLR